MRPHLPGSWDGGLWAHNYDIYLGVSPDPPLLAANLRPGPSQSMSDYRTYTLPTLMPGTSYYWKVVSKTMASAASAGQVWSFVTAGTAPGLATATDIDGDGRSDLVVFRKSTGTWLSLLSRQSYGTSQSGAWGNAADVPMAGDFDGDGRMDRTVYRPSNGTWYILKSSSGFTASVTAQAWGVPSIGDVPMIIDFDGDRRGDIAVWRPTTGTWHWLTSSTGFAYSSAGSRQWGSAAAGDVPVVK